MNGGACAAEATDKLMKQLQRQVMDSMVRSLPGNHVQHASQPRLRPSDLGLVDFHGARDSHATVVDVSEYPKLLLWVESTSQILMNSGLDESTQVRVMFSHLKGAARESYISLWRDAGLSACNMTELKSRIMGLVPSHKTHFTREALNMTFHSDKLASDIDRFTLYATNGDLPCDGYHFWYHVLIEKVIAASPDLFKQASELFNKTFTFTPTKTFKSHVRELIDLVMLVQSHLKAQLSGKRARADNAHDGGAAKKAKAGPSKPRQGIPTNDKVLAKAIGMCFGCGKLMPSGKAGFTAHMAACKKKYVPGVVSEEFSNAIAHVRRIADKKNCSDVAALNKVLPKRD